MPGGSRSGTRSNATPASYGVEPPDPVVVVPTTSPPSSSGPPSSNRSGATSSHTSATSPSNVPPPSSGTLSTSLALQSLASMPIIAPSLSPASPASSSGPPSASAFDSDFANLSAQRGDTIPVQYNDTWSTIAHRTGVSATDLANANPSVNELVPGMTIDVPATVSGVPPESQWASSNWLQQQTSGVPGRQDVRQGEFAQTSGVPTGAFRQGVHPNNLEHPQQGLTLNATARGAVAPVGVTGAAVGGMFGQRTGSFGGARIDTSGNVTDPFLQFAEWRANFLGNYTTGAEEYPYEGATGENVISWDLMHQTSEGWEMLRTTLEAGNRPEIVRMTDIMATYGLTSYYQAISLMQMLGYEFNPNSMSFRFTDYVMSGSGTGSGTGTGTGSGANSGRSGSGRSGNNGNNGAGMEGTNPGQSWSWRIG